MLRALRYKVGEFGVGGSFGLPAGRFLVRGEVGIAGVLILPNFRWIGHSESGISIPYEI